MREKAPGQSGRLGSPGCRPSPLPTHPRAPRPKIKGTSAWYQRLAYINTEQTHHARQPCARAHTTPAPADPLPLPYAPLPQVDFVAGQQAAADERAAGSEAALAAARAELSRTQQEVGGKDERLAVLEGGA